ncbi:MAG: hypothetical protein DRJ07_02520, partial [Bacteroidetes bacterium]
MKKLLLLFFALFSGALLFAQTTVSGTVLDAFTNDPIPGANIRVVGNVTGTSTDFDGKFSLKINDELPVSLEITFIGYTSKTVEINSDNENLTIVLDESQNALDEVVVSASRTPESLRESPVTIERMDVRAIKNSTSASFYTGLNNLKGIDIKTNSLTFNSVNAKGFSTFSNTRFVQLIDGMDNASPALNFVMGNLVGANELDLKSVEIIPGASSALYGANAFNGILFMTTKNPFDYQGISFYAKTGLTIQDSGDNNYIDFGIRAAHAFSDKFAAKISFSYLKGTDWMANDTNQYTTQGAGLPDKITPYDQRGYDHDAINIYGDEIVTDIHEVAKSMEAGGLIPGGASALVPSDNVGRTGYLEKDLTDHEAESAKVDISLNYRPMGDDLEISYNFRSGMGTTIYQGTNRYQLKGLSMTQNKIEIKNKNFFIRGYATNEDAKDSYDMVFTGINMNRDDSETWFGTYVGAYLEASMAGVPTSDEMHQIARAYADNTVTIKPGTPEFKKKFEEVTSDPDFTSGSRFVDKTKMYVGEGNYNFSSLFNDKFNLQAGGSYRRYSLNSAGTIFTDYDGPIDYDEIGAYIMASKKLMDERLILSASLRYDKNEFFDGSVSPRASVVYSAGENKQHNFRASFQTGFRNPTTQDLFIGLDSGRAILVGSSPDNLDRDLPNTDLTGRKAYSDSYSLTSVLEFSATGDPGKLNAVTTDLVQPEEVKAFDIGYRGNVERFSIDINAYYNIYDDFISQVVVVTPKNGSAFDPSGIADLVTGQTQVFSLYTNSPTQITSYGANIGVNRRVFQKLDLGFSYTWTNYEFDQE